MTGSDPAAATQRSHPSPSLGAPKLSESPSAPPCWGITHGVGVGAMVARGTAVGGAVGTGVGTAVGGGVGVGAAVAAAREGGGDAGALGLATVVAAVPQADMASRAAVIERRARTIIDVPPGEWEDCSRRGACGRLPFAVVIGGRVTPPASHGRDGLGHHDVRRLACWSAGRRAPSGAQP